jgi:hypothetical protein
VIVAAHSAIEALKVVRDLQDDGCDELHIRLLSGEELSEADLVERADRERATGEVVRG